jgi:hypothetical protein
MDRVLKSGLIAGVIGSSITLMNLIVLGIAVRIGQDETFLLVLLLANVLAFVVAGLLAGMLVFPYAPGKTGSLKSGLIAGGVVAYVPVVVICIFVFLNTFFAVVFSTHPVDAPSAILGGIALIFCMVAQAALSGLVSLGYASVAGWRKQSTAPASAGDEGLGLEDLKALYDDLWKDARTLANDMYRSIQLYLLAGIFTLIYGFVILAYALVSWQRIRSGSTDIADYAAAIGETIGGVIMVVVGPLLIRWYFKLKSRYASLASIEKGE